MNHLYSVAALTSAQGVVVERYAYGAYGQRVVLNADGSLKEGAAVQNYGFTGRELDGETGLWYFRARYFDDGLGRFVGRDPLGYVDGLSMYRGYFVPLGLDPTGMLRCCERIEQFWLAENYKDLIDCIMAHVAPHVAELVEDLSSDSWWDRWMEGELGTYWTPVTDSHAENAGAAVGAGGSSFFVGAPYAAMIAIGIASMRRLLFAGAIRIAKDKCTRMSCIREVSPEKYWEFRGIGRLRSWFCSHEEADEIAWKLKERCPSGSFVWTGPWSPQ